MATLKEGGKSGDVTVTVSTLIMLIFSIIIFVARAPLLRLFAAVLIDTLEKVSEHNFKVHDWYLIILLSIFPSFIGQPRFNPRVSGIHHHSPVT